MQKTILTDKLHEYALQFGVKEHQVLTQINEYNQSIANGIMQIPPIQGQFMALLAKIARVGKYLEVGVFTGYSSLSMALGMGKAGKIYAIDNSKEYIDIAKTFWKSANVDEQITVLLGDATEMLNSLCTKEHLETFDMAFIDANKSGYLEHYEYCYKLIKPTGIILIDNIFMHGTVLDNQTTNMAKAIQEFNEFISKDTRVDMVILPIADGLTIAYKKPIIERKI